MTQPWFRFYRAVVNSPKIQRLPAPLFKAWVNLLCCTDDEGELPSVADLAFTLRTSEREVAKLISSLIDAGLLIDTDGAVTAHDWNEHQRKSDTSNERVKRYRQRDRNGERNVTGNAPEEDTETEADTEAEKKGVGASAPPPPAEPPPDLWLVVEAYNEVAEPSGWPLCQQITSPRRSAMKARLAEAGGIEGWRHAMAKARASPFLRGETGRSAGHENWRPDIDFFLKPKSFTKLMEGGYDGQQGHRTGTPQGRGKPAISPGWLAGAVSAIEALEGGGVVD